MKPRQLTDLLAKTIPAGLPVLITGAPGIGKSDIVAGAADAAGADLITMHPVVSDPTDFKGLPALVAERAEFLPYGDLRALVDADRLTVCFLDDLGQAPPSVQAAAMQLILARRVNGHRVSPYVTFLAATNRRQDRAGVSGILEPVKSRFAAIVELEPDLDAWCAWAIAQALPVELVSFIRFRPEMLTAGEPTPEIRNTACPRTVAHAGRLLALGIDDFETLAGAAGEAFAAEFLAFLKIFRSLPNPDAVLLNPSTLTVPTDPATLYALCGAIAARAGANNADRVFEIAGMLPAEFGVLLSRDVVTACPEACASRGFIEWSSKNSAVLV